MLMLGLVSVQKQRGSTYEPTNLWSLIGPREGGSVCGRYHPRARPDALAPEKLKGIALSGLTNEIFLPASRKASEAPKIPPSIFHFGLGPGVFGSLVFFSIHDQILVNSETLRLT
jgi:hypothetical protein